MQIASSIKPFLAGLLLFCQFAAQSDSQKEKAPNQNEFKVVEHVPLISIDAEVISGATDSVIADLRHEDFIISENNVHQGVAFWQRLPVPLSLLIVVDAAANYTDSIAVDNRISALKSSLALFLKPEDEVSIIALTEGPLFLQDYTNNRDLINAALVRALQRKETPHLSAERRFGITLQEAAKHAGAFHNPEARRATILISDLPEKIANEIVLPEWVLRTVLDSALIFCWDRPAHPSFHFSNASTASFDSVSITALVGLTGGEFVCSDWKSFLERLRGRYRIAYCANTFGRSGDVVGIKLELTPSATRGILDPVLIYPRFAIIPFSKQ